MYTALQAYIGDITRIHISKTYLKMPVIDRGREPLPCLSCPTAKDLDPPKRGLYSSGVYSSGVHMTCPANPWAHLERDT